jgi:hypothetical protein
MACRPVGADSRPDETSDDDLDHVYFAYNVIKILRTLRVWPAIAAGVTDRPVDMSDRVALLVESELKELRSRWLRG